MRPTVAGAAAVSNRIPFSSRFRANRCTTRCCVPRQGNCQQLVFGRVMKKFLKWLGFVVVGLVGVGRCSALPTSTSRPSASWRVNTRSPTTLALVMPTDAVEIEEGHRLAHLAGCMHCHGDNLAGAVVDRHSQLVRLVRAEHQLDDSELQRRAARDRAAQGREARRHERVVHALGDVPASARRGSRASHRLGAHACRSSATASPRRPAAHLIGRAHHRHRRFKPARGRSSRLPQRGLRCRRSR